MLKIVDKNLKNRRIRDTRSGRRIRDLLTSENSLLVSAASSSYVSGSTVQTTVKDATVNESNNAVAMSSVNLAVTAPLTRLTGTITYSSSDPSVATVDPTGIVTPVAPGTVTITITIPGYNSRKVTLNITQNSGQNTVQFVDWVAGSLAAHIKAQVTSIIGSTPNPSGTLSQASLPPSRTTYGNLYILNADGTRNSGVWTGSLDTSCIGLSPTGQPGFSPICLIAPDIVAFATHVGNPSLLNTAYSFIDMAGVVHTANILSQSYPIPSQVGDNDITLVRLATPMPSSVKPAKVLPANYASYLPQVQYRIPCIFSNGDRTLLIGELDNWEQSVSYQGQIYHDIEVLYPTNTTWQKWYYGIRMGDSGTPCFLPINGELVLIHLWHFGGQYGPNYADNISAINAAMTALGSTYQLTTVDLSSFPTY